MSDAFNRGLYPVRPEEQWTSSSRVEGGLRGTQERGETLERSVPELAAELAEDEGDVEEEARTAKPLRDPRDPTAAERAVLIKTDNEPAILSLKEEMMRRFEVSAIPVESALHESESNGSVESGVKLFKGMLRVHLLALKRKLKGHIPSQHPVMTWLVECVADIVTKYTQGADGLTGYERLFGKQVHGDIHIRERGSETANEEQPDMLRRTVRFGQEAPNTSTSSSCTILVSLEYPASGERQVRLEPVLAQSSGHVDDDIQISASDVLCEMGGRESRYIEEVLDWYREDTGDLKISELNELVESMTSLSALEGNLEINQNVVTNEKSGELGKVARRSRWMKNS